MPPDAQNSHYFAFLSFASGTSRITSNRAKLHICEIFKVRLFYSHSELRDPAGFDSLIRFFTYNRKGAKNSHNTLAIRGDNRADSIRSKRIYKLVPQYYIHTYSHMLRCFQLTERISKRRSAGSEGFTRILVFNQNGRSVHS
jgi:hypothetical protein